MNQPESHPDPSLERIGRRDESYVLVAELLGLPTAERLSEHAPATREIACPICASMIRVADIRPIRALLRERGK